MAVDEKYLFYDSQAANSKGQEPLPEGNPMWLWNDQLLLVGNEQDTKCWYFTALDLITNETRPIYFQKSNSNFCQVKVITLNKDYGFVIESVEDIFCVNLVKLKWAPGEFQLIEQLNQEHKFSGILVSNLNPTKFVLRQRNGNNFIYQACTLDSGKIELQDTHEFSDFFEHYFNSKLFVVDGGITEFWIESYDWVTKRTHTFEISKLLDGKIDTWRVEWVKDRLYAAVYFDDMQMYKIGYTDLETLNWNFLDLSTDLRISKMQFFNGNLLVYAASNTAENDIFTDNRYLSDSVFCSEFKIYSIPTQCPQSLRKMAWPLVVQVLKRDKSIDDPYQAAAKFLPFNSDLRTPWYKEEAALESLEESTNDEQNQGQNNLDSTEATTGKTSESTSSQESSDAVPSKRTKFN